MRRLQTIVGILMRELLRKLPQDHLQNYKEMFELFEQVLNQQRNDKNKTSSFHEPHIYTVAKGKDHKKYEYGTKASVVMTKKSGIIVGVTYRPRKKRA